ncbi:MAG: putative leucyl/phenylalanyl-tRNA--protein transferase [Pseudomonadota bacterium]
MQVTRMRIPYLELDDPFPPPEAAAARPNGLVAAGADLSQQRLLDAYTNGIFPWYSEGDPILWWSPDPRMVLATQDFALRKSLAKRMRALAREGALAIRVDTDFAGVIQRCAGAREYAHGTWIVPEIARAYLAMHRLGYAHSVEVWRGEHLVGGLYGMCIGRMFYGESMFTHETDASKIALAALVHICRSENIPWIDCQQETSHLAFMGAAPMPRSDFLAGLKTLVAQTAVDWQQWHAQDLFAQVLARYDGFRIPATHTP